MYSVLLLASCWGQTYVSMERSAKLFPVLIADNMQNNSNVIHIECP
jgi:hypothetical protein